MPVNYLLLRALLQLYGYYGDSFKVEYPTGSGVYLALYQVYTKVAERLEKIFLHDETGRRAVNGKQEKFQADPHWRDLILFYEYFNGDSGAGIGASHQTGWTGCVARIIQTLGYFTPEMVLDAIACGGVSKFTGEHSLEGQ